MNLAQASTPSLVDAITMNTGTVTRCSRMAALVFASSLVVAHQKTSPFSNHEAVLSYQGGIDAKSECECSVGSYSGCTDDEESLSLSSLEETCTSIRDPANDAHQQQGYCDGASLIKDSPNEKETDDALKKRRLSKHQAFIELATSTNMNILLPDALMRCRSKDLLLPGMDPDDEAFRKLAADQTTYESLNIVEKRALEEKTGGRALHDGRGKKQQLVKERPASPYLSRRRGASPGRSKRVVQSYSQSSRQARSEKTADKIVASLSTFNTSVTTSSTTEHGGGAVRSNKNESMLVDCVPYAHNQYHFHPLCAWHEPVASSSTDGQSQRQRQRHILTSFARAGFLLNCVPDTRAVQFCCIGISKVRVHFIMNIFETSRLAPQAPQELDIDIPERTDLISGAQQCYIKVPDYCKQISILILDKYQEFVAVFDMVQYNATTSAC